MPDPEVQNSNLEHMVLKYGRMLARFQFDGQAQSRLESRSCGVKPFERWAWWMEERGGLHNPPEPESWWNASAAWRVNAAASASQSSNALPWTFVGPREVPVHGGAGRINRLVIDPSDENHWYACAPSGGLWHSVDAGGHWEVLGVDVLAPLGATDVWVDPNDSDHLWLATGDGMAETRTALACLKRGMRDMEPA